MAHNVYKLAPPIKLTPTNLSGTSPFESTGLLRTAVLWKGGKNEAIALFM